MVCVETANPLCSFFSVQDILKVEANVSSSAFIFSSFRESHGNGGEQLTKTMIKLTNRYVGLCFVLRLIH